MSRESYYRNMKPIFPSLSKDVHVKKCMIFKKTSYHQICDLMTYGSKVKVPRQDSRDYVMRIRMFP